MAQSQVPPTVPSASWELIHPRLSKSYPHTAPAAADGLPPPEFSRFYGHIRHRTLGLGQAPPQLVYHIFLVP